MLTKLLPDQVSKHWDIIKFAIEESLPPIAGENPNKMNNILMSILTDKTQCWASYKVGEEDRQFEGILLTRILYDDASGTRSLLLYCAYGYTKVSRESWFTGMQTVMKFAKSRNCTQLAAYTELEYLVNMAKDFGADSTYYFITFDIDKIMENVKNLNILE